MWITQCKKYGVHLNSIQNKIFKRFLSLFSVNMHIKKKKIMENLFRVHKCNSYDKLNKLLKLKQILGNCLDKIIKWINKYMPLKKNTAEVQFLLFIEF